MNRKYGNEYDEEEGACGRRVNEGYLNLGERVWHRLCSGRYFGKIVGGSLVYIRVERGL